MSRHRKILVRCNKQIFRIFRIISEYFVQWTHGSGNIIDHNAVLSYIEPYASSACEMVAEVLQYIVDDINLTPMEANSMYAGIMIDTNNFMNRTGVRTFEAAAFLRRCGTDSVCDGQVLRSSLPASKAPRILSSPVYSRA